MNPPLKIRATLALFVLLALNVVTVPSGANAPIDTTTTRQYLQDFEAYLSGSVACSRPEDSWCTSPPPTVGSGSNQVFSPATAGSGKAWRITDTSSGYAAQLRNLGPGVDLCVAGQVLEFDFALGGAIGPTQSFDFRASSVDPVGTSRPAGTLGLSLVGSTGADNLVAYVTGSSSATTTIGTYTPPGIVHVTIGSVNCGGSEGSAVITATGACSGSCSATVTDGTSITGPFNRFTVASTGASASGTFVDLDNYQWTGAPLPAPTLSSVTPNTGTTAGGTSVALAGTGFVTGATVTFGGVAATSVAVASPTSITATTPARAAGSVNVVVTNPDGQSSTLAGGYTYGTPCSVSAATQDAQETYDDLSVPSDPARCWYVRTENTGGADKTASFAGVATGGYSPDNGDAVFIQNPTPTPATGAGLHPLMYRFPDVSSFCDTVSAKLTPVEWKFKITQFGTSQSVVMGLTTSDNLPQGGSSGDLTAGVYFTVNGATGAISTGPNGANGFVGGGNFGPYTGNAGATITENTLQSFGTAALNEWFKVEVLADCFDDSIGEARVMPSSICVSRVANPSQRGCVRVVNPSANPSTLASVMAGLNRLVVTYRCNQPSNCAAPGSVRVLIDDVLVKGRNTAPNRITAPGDVVGLTGFDVDPADRAIITRVNGGAKVESRDPTSPIVAKTGEIATATCQRADGVATYYDDQFSRNFLTFANCDEDGFVNTLSIRNQVMGPPDRTGTVCEDNGPVDGDSWCEIDLQTGDCEAVTLGGGAQEEELPGGLGQLGYFSVARWNWRSGLPGASGPDRDHASLAFLYTDIGNGNLGIWTITQNNDQSDCTDRTEVAFSPGNAPGQICYWRDNQLDRDLFGAIDVNGGTKSYSATFENQGRLDGSFAFEYNLKPSMTTAGIFGAPFNNGRAIGCAERYLGNATAQSAFFVGADGKGRVFKIAGGGLGEQLCTVDIAAPVLRGGDMSLDGRWISWVDGSVAYVGNATNCQAVGSYPLPAGDFKGMQLHGTGQTLWVATSDFIAGWDIYEQTTIVAVPAGTVPGSQVCFDSSGVEVDCDTRAPIDVDDPVCGSLCPGRPTTAPGGATGGLGAGANGLGTIFGGGAETGGLMMCAILIFAFLGVGLSVAPRGAGQAIGAGAGAVLGFVLCFVSELLSPLVVFCVVAVAAGVVYFRFFRGE